LPHPWLFFIPFIAIMTFSLLDLFFGLIVNGMQRAADKENEEFLSKKRKKKANQNEDQNLSQSSVDRMDALEAKVDRLLVGIESLTKRSDT
jgi:hypothetical protein